MLAFGPGIKGSIPRRGSSFSKEDCSKTNGDFAKRDGDDEGEFIEDVGRSKRKRRRKRRRRRRPQG